MKPSAALNMHRPAMIGIFAKHRTSNPRVFGSVARGEDSETSDLDIMVDTLPDASLFDLIGLEIELADLLGVKVDVVTAAGLRPRIRAQAMAEAAPL